MLTLILAHAVLWWLFKSQSEQKKSRKVSLISESEEDDSENEFSENEDAGGASSKNEKSSARKRKNVKCLQSARTNVRKNGANE